ncbi:hypothetical protein [Dactylosporangium sp. NPDC005555]|uniref:hypothetical protein n=1 Tax=Dactylosporangium sp. NPDC005555 TaxID=3154889 RepID=UPI0033B4CFBA
MRGTQAQRLWDEPRFQGAHVLHRRIPDAAHFPWVEQPSAVRAAFHELAGKCRWVSI